MATKKPSNKAKLMSETHLSSDEEVPVETNGNSSDKARYVNLMKGRDGKTLSREDRHLVRRCEAIVPGGTSDLPVVWELPAEADELVEHYPWLTGVFMMWSEAFKLQCRNINPAKKDPSMSPEDQTESIQEWIDGVMVHGKWYKEGEQTKRRTKTRILAECFLELGLAKTKNLEELEEYFKQVHPKEKKTIGEMVLHPTSKYEEVRQLYKEKTEKKASNFDASDLELDI